jgi:ABC-type transporter Mla subunit MlaD
MRTGFSFRDLVDPVASRGGGHPHRTGAIVLLVAVLAVTLVFLNAVPFLDSQSGYTVTANFAEANNVSHFTPVRVDGVDVGEVTGLGAGPDPRRSSQVKMLITDAKLVVHSDASAAIRWRTVLGGNMYIDLDPGSPDAPKLTGAIPVSRTSDQVELDDVLRIYNGSTDQAQRSMIAGLSRTFASPARTDRSIEALRDLSTVGRGLSPYQGTDPGDLSKLVASTAHTVRELGSNTAGLQTLVDGAASTFGAVDAQRTALGQTLELGPGTLQSTRVTTARVDVTLAKLDPLVRRLEPGAQLIAATSRATRPALARLQTVLDQAQPLLASTRPTLANLRSVAGTGVPLLQQLQAPLAALNANILPWLQQRSSDTRLLNYESVGPFFSVLDGAAGEYDSSGYRLHLSTLLGSASVLDEADLTQGEQSLMSQCKAAATASETPNCGAVTQALAGMLYGGQR